MLHRAASNAYSWWWASHVRTKQSRWLEQSLQDMEERVNNTLKIIDNDGDSFAQRAEMYYKQRPEIVNFVEESFRAYRALAERYDHLSKDLQSANSTIATVFPERVPYAMDDDDEDGENLPVTSAFFNETDMPDVCEPSNPNVPNILQKEFMSKSMFSPRKGSLARTPTSAKAASIPILGLSKPEALEEIDKLQKDILALQTEKEFAKGVYEGAYEKYWEIENESIEMQKRVSSLQDEFEVGSVIKDDEARTLMAATALKSCEETLVKLQEKQEKSAEEAREEQKRIKEAHERFERARSKLLLPKDMDGQKHKFLKKGQQLKSLDQGRFEAVRSKFLPKDMNVQEHDQSLSERRRESKSLYQEKRDMVLLQETTKEQLDVNSMTSPTSIDMVEKINALVNKVVNFETDVSSQTALVKRLRSETNELQTHIRSLEEDKESLKEGSDITNKKLKELEEELREVKDLNRSVEDQNKKLRAYFTVANCDLDILSGELKSVKLEVKNLNQSIEDQNKNLQTYFTEANCDLDHLSGELKSVKLDEEVKDVSETKSQKELSRDEKEEKKDDSPILGDSDRIEEENQSDPTSKNLVVMREEPQELKQHEKDDNLVIKLQESGSEKEEEEEEEEEEEPIWKKLFVRGLEDREKILLDEYTSVLRNYEIARKKLSEEEKKNRESIFELAMQIRELKTTAAAKDELIQSLLHKLTGPHPSAYTTPEYKYIHQRSISHGAISRTPLIQSQKSLHDFYGEQDVESVEIINESPGNLRISTTTEEENNNKIKPTRRGKHHAVSTIEKKFRSDIDGLLEENLEFWLRFSTSVHQIEKFQTSINDLHEDLLKLKDKKKQQASGKQQSDVRPIYRHMREIQAEVSLWLEHNTVLKDELQGRYSSLQNIQDDILRISHADSKAEKPEISEYKAIKFQGEVLNMKLENKKISNELQVGLSRVRALQVEVEKTMAELDEELGISMSKKQQTTGRDKVPLRSFLFGVRLKNRQKTSIFSCVSPALQKQYNGLPAPAPAPTPAP